MPCGCGVLLRGATACPPSLRVGEQRILRSASAASATAWLPALCGFSVLRGVDGEGSSTTQPRPRTGISTQVQASARGHLVRRRPAVAWRRSASGSGSPETTRAGTFSLRAISAVSVAYCSGVADGDTADRGEHVGKGRAAGVRAGAGVGVAGAAAPMLGRPASCRPAQALGSRWTPRCGRLGWRRAGERRVGRGSPWPPPAGTESLVGSRRRSACASELTSVPERSHRQPVGQRRVDRPADVPSVRSCRQLVERLVGHVERTV